MPLDFRPACVADIPLLRGLADRIWRACYPDIITPGADRLHARLDVFAREDRGRTRRRSALELALHEGLPAGFLALTFQSDTLAELNKLYLRPELHGQATGRRCLRGPSSAPPLAATASCACA